MSPIPQALARAFAKAEDGELFTTVRYDVAANEWIVPSRTNEREYRVAPRHAQYDSRGRKVTPGTPWFVKLWCSCPAQASDYNICWHKAAVYLAHLHGLVPDLSGEL